MSPNMRTFSAVSVNFLLLVIISVTLQLVLTQKVTTLKAVMRNAKPVKNDEYLCSSHELPANEELYITQYEALADAGRAHHILLFGCDEPAVKAQTWHCGRICKSQEQILFAWAKNAPPLKLPKDVGFRVGANTQIKHIVVQVHYVNPLPAGVPFDNSGISLTLTSERQPYLAGIYLLLAYSVVIPGNTPKIHADISCQFKARGPGNIYPFGFRTHAHSLGRVISGYQVNGTYHEIGKGNPQWPQAFYPVENKIVIKPGDYLVGRCTYNSTGRSRTTYIGATASDEMCNFYIMYYADPLTRLEYHTCAGNNFPSLIRSMPADADVPLPPNPLLEEAAHGHHGHMGDPEGHDDVVKTTPKPTPSTMAPIPTTKKPELVTSHMVDFDSDFVHGKDGSPTSGADDAVIGQVGGVAADKNGNVYVFHRGERVWNGLSFNARNEFQQQDQPIKANTIIIYNKDGQIIRKFARDMFYMPHGISVDDNNNIWVTDVALHQVMRFPENSDTPDIVIGQRFKPGNDKTHFCKPSDVVVLKSGELFISDGYCNSRIAKFDSTGKYLSEFGREDNSVFVNGYPPEGSFEVPHSLALAEDKGLLCVADRENGRIQCFDLEGQFQKQIHPPEFGERLFAVSYCPSHGGLLFAVNGPAFRSGVTVQGFIIDINTGELIETWNSQPGLQNPHDIEVDPVNNRVYVGELDPTKVWRFDMKADDESGSIFPVYTTTQRLLVTMNTSGPIIEDTKKAVLPEEDQVLPAIIIGALLVIPVIIIIVFVVVVRVYRKGQYNCCGRYQSRTRKKFNLGNFLSPHRGFDRLSQEESESEFDPLNDSDQEEYTISRKA